MKIQIFYLNLIWTDAVKLRIGVEWGDPGAGEARCGEEESQHPGQLKVSVIDLLAHSQTDLSY